LLEQEIRAGKNCFLIFFLNKKIEFFLFKSYFKLDLLLKLIIFSNRKNSQILLQNKNIFFIKLKL